MMLLKKIHHLVKDNISETINLVKDIKDIKNKVISLEEQIKEKDNKLLELEKINSKHAKDINILASDIIVLSNFAKEKIKISTNELMDERAAVEGLLK